MKKHNKLKLPFQIYFAIILLAKISLGEGNEDLSGSVSITAGPTLLKVGESGTFTATKSDDVNFSGGGWSVSGNTATKTITENDPVLTKDHVTCKVTKGNESYTATYTCYWVEPKIKKIIIITSIDFYDEKIIYNSLGTKYSYNDWEINGSTITKYPFYHIGGTIISLGVDVEGIPNGLVYDVQI